MTASNPTPTSYPASQPSGYDALDRTPTTADEPPTGMVPVATNERPRTITVRIAAVIATVAFLVGLGVAMLLGPVLGGPGGTPPDGGPGGTPPGASTSQSSTTGT